MIGCGAAHVEEEKQGGNGEEEGFCIRGLGLLQGFNQSIVQRRQPIREGAANQSRDLPLPRRRHRRHGDLMQIL